MNKIYSLLFLAALMVCCTPADKPEDKPTEPPVNVEFSVGPAEVILLDEVSYKSEITIVSNTKWSAQKSDSSTWFDISPTSAEAGTTIITVTVKEPNSVYEDRESMINIKCGSITESIRVIQKKKNALIIYPKECLVHYSGDDINVDARANVEYTVSLPENKDWIRHKVTAKGLDMVGERFTVDPNPSKEYRSTIIIFKDKNSSLADTIAVIQQGNTEPCNYTVETAGTLGEMLTKNQKDTIIYMKLWGNLNVADFTTMRDDMRKLQYLDLSEVTLENNTIPDNAFFTEAKGGKKSLSRVIFPGNLVGIGHQAFAGCNGLKGELIIPQTVVSIGVAAFQSCGFTGELRIPSSVETIGDLSFSFCNSFTGSLVIPNSVTYIGEGAFNSCSGFDGSLTLSSSAKKIGEAAFAITGFRGSLTIPFGVEIIGHSAFSNCSFTGELSLPSTLTNIEPDAFFNCASLVGDLNIPQSVEAIGGGAFRNCSRLNGALTLPSELAKIENSVFTGCSALSGELLIPASVNSIEDFAFSGCESFSGTCQIPSGVQAIGSFAFEDCNGLDKMRVSWSTPIQYADWMFPYQKAVEVPVSAVSLYEQAEGWSTHQIIGY